jgi:hypothetical protein
MRTGQIVVRGGSPIAVEDVSDKVLRSLHIIYALTNFICHVPLLKLFSVNVPANELCTPKPLQVMTAQELRYFGDSLQCAFSL